MKTRLYELRKSKNLLQKDVALACGMSTRAYGSYEADEREPSLAALNILADFFDVTVDELLGRNVSPGMFDDARVPKSEIQELFDAMSPDLQSRLIAYAYGLLAREEVESSSSSSIKNKRA